MTNLVASMIGRLQQQFRSGMPVFVGGASRTGRKVFRTSQVVGTIVDWRHEETGASYSQYGSPRVPNADGKLQLLRLRLQMVDGAISDLVIDDLTTLAKLEAT